LGISTQLYTGFYLELEAFEHNECCRYFGEGFRLRPDGRTVEVVVARCREGPSHNPGRRGDQKICLSNALAELDGTPHQHKIIGQVVRLLLGHEPVPGAGGAEVDNDLVIQSYRLGAIIIERVDQRTGPAKWAVRSQFGECLSQSGDWEAEPSPSSRDTAFLERCRFPDEESAIAAARVSFGAGY